MVGWVPPINPTSLLIVPRKESTSGRCRPRAELDGADLGANPAAKPRDLKAAAPSLSGAAAAHFRTSLI